MSQVQNNTLHNIAQPITFMAIAYLAGSKRCIQFFPGASRGGLLLAAGIGSAATLASPHIPAPAFLKTDQKDESARHSLIRVTASLALGTLTAHFADKILKGRVSLCMHAAGRFIALETVIALAFAAYSASQVAPTPGGGDPKTLEEKHAAYKKDLDSWNKLPEKERSEFAKKCFDNKNLAALPLKEGDFDIKLFAELPKQDVAKLTANQLEWFSAICTRGLTLTVEQEFALNAARDTKGLDATWVNVTQAHIKYALDEDLTTLLHGYYSTHADAWDALDDKTRGAFVLAWFKGDLPVVSTEKAKVCLEAFKKDLSDDDDLSTYTKNQIEWLTELSSLFKSDMNAQFALNATRQTHGLDPVWNDDVTKGYVEYALDQGQAALIHGYFSENPFALALIESKANGITEAVNKAYNAAGLAPIPNAHDILTGLKTDEIDALSKNEAHFASAYMVDKDTPTNFNTNLSPEQQLAYNAVFEKHDTKRFWIWPIVQAHVTFMATHDASLTRFHKKMSGAPEAFGAIPDGPRQELEKLFDSRTLAAVPNALEILQKLTPDDIAALDNYKPYDWHEFFQTHPNQWSAIDLLKQQAFFDIFNRVDGMKVEVQIELPAMEAIPKLSKNDLESLLELNKQGLQLPKGMRKALGQQLKAINEAEQQAAAEALRREQEAEEARRKEEAAALPALPQDQKELDALDKAGVEGFLQRHNDGEEMNARLVEALQARLQVLNSGQEF